MRPHPYPVVIGLGCNLGPRRRMLELACKMLEEVGVRVGQRSRLYWTRPWGVDGQPDYLNAAIEVQTGLTPMGLLARCQQVEGRLGRSRDLHWGPRTIDLDLLIYGQIKMETPALTLPHPLAARRDFVLAPLGDLAVPVPSWMKASGWRELIGRIPPHERVIRSVETWK